MAQSPDRSTVTIEFNADQIEALKALLDLIHYDDLATSWRNILPPSLHPLGLTILSQNLWEIENDRRRDS